MNSPFESSGNTLVTYAETSGHHAIKMGKSSPEKFLHHIAVASFVSMRERIARGGDCTTKASQPTGMNAQSVTGIVQPDGMSKLGKEQTDNVAPWRESPRLLVDAMLAGEFGNEIRRNELAELSRHWQFGFG